MSQIAKISTFSFHQQLFKFCLTINPLTIHRIPSFQLIDDTFALAQNEWIPYERAFRLIDYLRHETNPMPWLAAAVPFHVLLNSCNPAQRKILSKYIVELIDGVYGRVGISGDASTDDETLIYSSSNIAYHACQFGHEGCIADAKQLFATYRAGEYV